MRNPATKVAASEKLARLRLGLHVCWMALCGFGPAALVYAYPATQPWVDGLFAFVLLILAYILARVYLWTREMEEIFEGSEKAVRRFVLMDESGPMLRSQLRDLHLASVFSIAGTAAYALVAPGIGAAIMALGCACGVALLGVVQEFRKRVRRKYGYIESSF